VANHHQSQDPLILLIPGFAEGGASDWMQDWENRAPDCERLDLGMWDQPHRNTWVNKLNLAIHHAGRPVVLVAHDIGCLAAAWWAEYEQPDSGEVIGALLVSPPDVDRPGVDPRLAAFGACPRQALPFPSFVLADDRAPQAKLVTTTQLASDWGSAFSLEHIGERSWEAGLYLLGRLLGHRPDHGKTQPARHIARELVSA
jgi:predicted alpha/beta hydrolase family esterase